MVSEILLVPPSMHIWGARFGYLTRSSIYQLDDVDDVLDFEKTIKAMQSLKMDQQKINDILAAVATVLNLSRRALALAA